MSKKEWNETYNKKYPCRKHYWAIEQRCKQFKSYIRKGIKNYLSIEDIKMLWERDSASKLNKPSIDRIDNDGDYTIENCRFIELSDNISKDTRGEKCHLSKLTEKNVKAIIKMRRDFNSSINHLALTFDVSEPNIYSILKGKTWKHLKEVRDFSKDYKKLYKLNKELK